MTSYTPMKSKLEIGTIFYEIEVQLIQKINKYLNNQLNGGMRKWR